MNNKSMEIKMTWEDELRKLMKEEYGNIDEASENGLENFIQSLLKKQREICADKVADKMRGDYYAQEIDGIDEIILTAPEPEGDK